jgi:hypothetical protein
MHSACARVMHEIKDVGSGGDDDGIAVPMKALAKLC